MRESSGSPLAAKAKRLLSIREGDIARGLPITPGQSRITISELLEHVKDDYQVNHKKTYRDLEARCRLHLLPFFGNYRACNLTTDEVRAYIRKRQSKGATNAANPHLLSQTNAAQRDSLEGIP